MFKPTRKTGLEAGHDYLKKGGGDMWGTRCRAYLRIESRGPQHAGNIWGPEWAH